VETETIKVLIADDSPLVREILKDMIEGERDLELVGEAENGKVAVELAGKIKPDIITMDVIMPVMNGLEAVEEIMAYSPAPILVFSSALNNKEMDVAFQAIARGALDVMEKPRMDGTSDYDTIREDFLSKLRMLSRIQVISHLKGKRRKNRASRAAETEGPAKVSRTRSAVDRQRVEIEREEEIPPPQPEVAVQILTETPEAAPVEIPPKRLIKRDILAVGASTGGPKALVQIFKRFPAAFPLPVVVVQHIAPSFAQGLVSWMDRESQMKIKVAEDKIKPEVGTVYVSPTGNHMLIEKGMIRLTDSEPVNSCKPSVDVLFDSVAKEMGNVAVGVLLTGMGRDGAAGLKLLRDRKARTIVQDEATCVIFGMPRVALEMGAAQEVVSLFEIPEAIVRSITR